MFTKEKNLLTFTVKTKKNPEGINYQFDFNTGKTIQLDNQKECTARPMGAVSELKSIIKTNAYGTTEHNYAQALLFIYDIWHNRHQELEDLQALSNMVEKIYAMGKKFSNNYHYEIDQLQYINDNFKYIKDYPADTIYYIDFMNYVLTKTMTQRNGNWAMLTQNEMQTFFRYFKDNDIADAETQDAIINVYLRSYIREFFRNTRDSINAVIKYAMRCKYLDHKLEHKNFMREYVEVKRSYDLMKTEIDSKRIAENYNRHSKAWEFEYNGFTVVIPTSGEDLITEGQRMHHCVGGYVKSIVEGRDYICFIRKTNDIDKPYITCEVYRSGKIGQYYLAYDRHISSNADKEFKAEFQKHLNKMWNK